MQMVYVLEWYAVCTLQPAQLLVPMRPSAHAVIASPGCDEAEDPHPAEVPVSRRCQNPTRIWLLDEVYFNLQLRLLTHAHRA